MKVQVFNREDPSQPAIELELRDRAWEALEEEARRSGATVEQTLSRVLTEGLALVEAMTPAELEALRVEVDEWFRS